MRSRRPTRCLTGRAGLWLFIRYLRNIETYLDLERLFGPLRKSVKGQPVRTLFHQIFNFIEGFYNPRRRHSALDYESPISYERKHRSVA